MDQMTAGRSSSWLSTVQAHPVCHWFQADLARFPLVIASRRSRGRRSIEDLPSSGEGDEHAKEERLRPRFWREAKDVFYVGHERAAASNKMIKYASDVV